jgi:hypothetical protein
MIVIKLQGGLGNQMFQYAFGKAISIKLSSPLYFDNSFFKLEESSHFSNRHYNLDVFPFHINLLSKNKISNFINPNPIQRLLNKLNLNRKDVFKEITLEFSERVFNLSNNLYLDGYWQSEQYFNRITTQVRKDFEFIKPFSSLSESISCTLAKENNAVSVHIRRGDYISSATNSKVHGTCPIDYYHQAMRLLNAKLNKPQFYFFSDEPEWVEQNLVNSLNNFQIIKHNQGTDSWQDMALMSKCKHHIIANSSFSWWGAWLNPSPDKIVIAPKIWFADPGLNDQSATIIAENWIRI